MLASYCTYCTIIKFSKCFHVRRRGSLLLCTTAGEYNGHADEDVDGVHVDGDGVVDGVEVWRRLGVLHNLLRVVQQEHAEEDQATVDRYRVEANAQSGGRRQEHAAC